MASSPGSQEGGGERENQTATRLIKFERRLKVPLFRHNSAICMCIQWNLLIRTPSGPAVLSFVYREVVLFQR